MSVVQLVTHTKPLHAEQRVDSPISTPSHSQQDVNILQAALSPYVRECRTWHYIVTQYSHFMDRSTSCNWRHLLALK